ncbi:MAG: (2Fe-2S) ferredoxin domain-containing protein [bacterium]|nr:(2Fe-2S) ferredoxin domain-containing protein [bacterium]
MTLDELRKIRERAAAALEQRARQAQEPEWKIVVSMGTSGILYGAREILKKIMEEVQNLGLNVIVTQSGSFGLDDIEPMCAIYHGNEKVVYGNLKPDMIRELLETHIVRGQILASHRVVVPGDVGNTPTTA